jgi:WD40 repeat protein
MGTARLRHYHIYGALATAFSPDGKVIATGGHTSLRLWDAATGKLIRQIRENYQYGGVLFSPDGKWLATGGDKAVCLLDAATGRLRRRLPGAGYLFALSPDGGQLVTAAEQGCVAVWDTASAKEVLRLRGHEQDVISAAFTADGRGLITLCRAKRICHWDIKTGQLQKTLTLELPQWRTLALSADGRTLAVVPYSREPVVLWDTDTGKERVRLQGAPAGARYGLAFTADGRTLATHWADEGADESTISLWDTATGRPLRRFGIPAGAAGFLQFSPDGRTLLSTGNVPLVYLWDVATGKPLLHHPAHEGQISSLVFTPDGRTLVSGSHDGTLRLWDAATGRPTKALTGHRWGVNAVALLPDGRAVLSSGTDGTLRLWDLAAGKEVRRLDIDDDPQARGTLNYQVLCMALAPDGSAAAFSFRGGPQDAKKPRSLLHVWDSATGKVLSRRPVDSPDNNLEVRLFSPDLRAYVKYTDPASLAAAAKADPGDKKPLPPSGTSLVELKDVATGRPLLALPQPDRCGYREAFSPDGRLLATVTFRLGLDGNNYRQDRHTIHLWELASGTERLSIVGPEVGFPSRFVQLAFSPDGSTLATAREDGTLQLWDLSTGQELVRHAGAQGDVRCLAVAPDGKALAAGYADSTILLWGLSAARRVRPPVPDLETCWADLAGADGRKAHAAINGLLAMPQQAVALLRARLSPTAGVGADRLRRLLDELDSNEFARREAASKELADLEELVLPALERALRADPSPEKRRRIETLLAGPRLVRSPAALRGVRAVEVLEHVGTPGARGVLEALSRGAPEARLTQEAKAALRRLPPVRFAAP